MPRFWIWLQLLVGWFPVWALYATLIVAAHPPTSARTAAAIAVHAIVPAALLGLGVYRLTRLFPWPRPFRIAFPLVHVLVAGLYSVSWMLLASGSELLLNRSAVIMADRTLIPFLVLGVWLYVMVAGVSYAAQATDRAVVAEASAAKAQLAALRAQLHPHFLFNALHTVVQLIPREPARAAEAAELVAGVLRTTLEEDRELVTVREEVAFVRRYLDIERIRFGDRLVVDWVIDPATESAMVPAFALQTLVENAVQHGASPRIEPTTIRVEAIAGGGTLQLVVSDFAPDEAVMMPAMTPSPIVATAGTGLTRLRERLSALYGQQATTQHGPLNGGYRSAITMPLSTAAERHHG